MKQVVQARCPGCRNVLRVPADWIGQSIRCKHCGKIIQAKKKSPGGEGAGADDVSPAPATTPRTAAPAQPARGVGTAPPDVNPVEAEAVRPSQGTPATPGDQPFGQLGDDGGIVVPRYRRRKWGSGWIIGLVALGILVV